MKQLMIFLAVIVTIWCVFKSQKPSQNKTGANNSETALLATPLPQVKVDPKTTTSSELKAPRHLATVKDAREDQAVKASKETAREARPRDLVLKDLGIVEVRVHPRDLKKVFPGATDADETYALEMANRGLQEMVIIKKGPGLPRVKPTDLTPACAITQHLERDVIAKIDSTGKIVEAVTLRSDQPVPTELYECSYAPILINNQPSEVAVVFRHLR